MKTVRVLEMFVSLVVCVSRRHARGRRRHRVRLDASVSGLGRVTQHRDQLRSQPELDGSVRLRRCLSDDDSCQIVGRGRDFSLEQPIRQSGQTSSRLSIRWHVGRHQHYTVER